MADTTDSYQQIQQLLAEWASVSSTLRLMPAVTAADANKLIRVDGSGAGYILTPFDLDTFGAAARTRIIETAAGSGLTGGGNLTADRSLALNINGMPAIADLALTDRFPLYDVSATANGRGTPQQLLNLVGGLTALTALDAGDGLMAWDASASVAKLLTGTLLSSAARGLSLNVYTAAATYAVPADLVAALVIMTGGGGGGGRATGSTTLSATGGGGGAGSTTIGLFTRAALIAAVPSGNVPVVVGAGGPGATLAAGRGFAGGTTTFAALLSAAGGAGGGNAAAGNYVVGGAGGALPTLGSIKLGGASGLVGAQPKPSGLVYGGMGGLSFWGGGSAMTSATSTAVAGGAGRAAGSGGQGGAAHGSAVATGLGGAGSAGLGVILGLRTA